jgi:hypothetical protein
MTVVRITERPDLTPILGELAEDTAARLLDDLGRADVELAGTVDELNARGGADFATGGVLLESEISGQTLIRTLVENAKGTVGFSAELRPRNFYGDEESPWRPGRPPMRMATDAWDVEGAVSVRFKTRVASRPYTIQEQVLELDEERHETPESAVAAFVAACAKLVELALSRDPTVAAWKPEIPEEVGGPPPMY